MRQEYDYGFWGWVNRHPRLTITIPIIGIILSCIGLAWNHWREPPEPVPMTYDTKFGTYCYVDVQLMTRWLLREEGERSTTTYYMVVDDNDHYFIAAILDKFYEEMTDIAVYSNSDETESAVPPEPYRLYGKVQGLSDEALSDLSSSLDFSEDAFRALLGEGYLNTDSTPKTDTFYICLFALCSCGIAVIFFLTDYRFNRQGLRRDIKRDMYS